MFTDEDTTAQRLSIIQLSGRRARMGIHVQDSKGSGMSGALPKKLSDKNLQESLLSSSGILRPEPKHPPTVL